MPHTPSTPSSVKIVIGASAEAIAAAHGRAKDRHGRTTTTNGNESSSLGRAATGDATASSDGAVVAPSLHRAQTIAEAKDVWRNEGNPN